jgi:hypothetical protein
MTPGFSPPDDRDAAMAAAAASDVTPSGATAFGGTVTGVTVAAAAGVEARAQGADSSGEDLDAAAGPRTGNAPSRGSGPSASGASRAESAPSASGRPSASPAAANVAPCLPDLQGLEAEGRRRGLLLRLQVGRPLGLLWSLRVAVARREPPGPGAAAGALLLLGEIKGWAWPAPEGLRLDTMRVRPQHSSGVGPLLSAAAFAWSLEASPCRVAHILAIRDGELQHRRLVRYFRGLGFEPLRELGGAPGDLLPRLVWGGAGLRMRGSCEEGLRRSWRRLVSADPPEASR